MPALVRFYSRILESQAEGDDTHAEFNMGGLSLAIFSRHGMETMAPGSMQGAGYGGITIAFEVTDVDKEFERLQALEVTFVKQPATYPWGARLFWFRDPDGNIIDFYSRVSQ